MNYHFSTAILIAFVSFSNAFPGSKVFRTVATTTEQVKVLTKLFHEGNLDFWTLPKLSVHGYTDILASGRKILFLASFLKRHGFTYSIMIEDVEKLISEQRSDNEKLSSQSPAVMTWKSYQRYETILGWLDDLELQYSNVVSLITIGKSTEGRDLKVVKISTGGKGKYAVFIGGGFHGSEWISPAAVTFIVNELVTKHSFYRVLSDVDFYILPMINPDGYEFAHQNANTRLWWKTRSNYNSAFGCMGADPNRNFDFQWGGAGSSSNKCSSSYMGTKPFSEPEVRAVRDFILSYTENDTRPEWTMYITIHGYGQLWSTPWNFKELVPEDCDNNNIASGSQNNELPTVHSPNCGVDINTKNQYETAGSSEEWAKGFANIQHSVKIELKDNGRFGFLLPAEQIIFTAKEAWSAVLYSAELTVANLV